MLESHAFRMDGVEWNFTTQVRNTEDLPKVLEFWMAHFARDLLRLGVYFRAAALMCQIPGGARYRRVFYDDRDDERPNQDEDPWRWVGEANRSGILNVLAECLRRLGAMHVMKQIPGGTDFEPRELSAEWKEYLDRHAKIKHGLLNVVAECLDKVVVEPEITQIDAVSYPTWWQRWWSRME